MEKFTLSFSPHIRDNSSTQRIMLDVIIALLPSACVGVYFFGMSAAITLILSIVAAVLTEAIIQKLCKRPVTVFDLSAVLTGLLLGMNLPSGVPMYVPIVGSFFAIGIVKQCFGGLGNNFLNPALAARVMLMTSWPVAMTTFPAPGPDAVATATPLAIIKAAEPGSVLPSIADMAIGNIPGCIGEVSAIALVIGAAYLFIRRVITWHIPVAFIATVAVFCGLVKGIDLLPYELLGGGLIIGAFFMATDYVTTPITPAARIVFGIGCGVVTSVIRLFGGYPEGVSFSILFMNLFTPLLERAFSPKVYGIKKEAKAK